MDIVRNVFEILGKKQKRQFALLFIMIVISAFLETIGISFIIPFMSAIMSIDSLMQYEIIKEVMVVFELSQKELVILLGGTLIVVYVVKGLFKYRMQYTQYIYVYGYNKDLSIKLLKNTLNYPYEKFIELKSAEIIRTVTNDVNAVCLLILDMISLFVEIVVFASILILMLFVETKMTLFLLGMLLVALLVISFIVRPMIEKAGAIQREQNAEMVKWINQASLGIKEIKISNKEKFFANEFANAAQKHLEAVKRNKMVAALPTLIIETGSVVAILIFLIVLIMLDHDLQEILPNLSAMALAIVRLVPGVIRVNAYYNEIIYLKPSLYKISEEVSLADNNAECMQDKKRISFKKEIRIDNLSYAYPNTEKKIIDDVSITLQKGECIAFIGKTGAGKTTFVDLILGLLKPNTGRILVDGEDIAGKEKAWTDMVGYVPQSIFLLDDSIKKNVAFGDVAQDIDEERVWRALEQAQLAEYVATLNNKLNEQIGERGVKLSGGQKQRLGIARALYREPSILVFDEGTSALDNETEAALMDSINNLQKSKTIMLIAHRLNTIANSDIVFKVEDGKVIQVNKEDVL